MFGFPEGSKWYIRKIDHENKIIYMVGYRGDELKVPFSEVGKYVKKEKMRAYYDTGKHITASLTENDPTSSTITKVMNSVTDKDVFTPEQLDKIRKVATDKLLNGFSNGSEYFMFDKEKNHLVAPVSFTLKNNPDRYEIIFPADKNFEEAIANTPIEVMSAYSGREVMKNSYKKIMAEKFPSTHTPPKTASEVERFYQEATGYDDEKPYSITIYQLYE